MTLVQHPLPKGARLWTNSGADIPHWVRLHIVESPCPNGSFLVETPLGRTRVHEGDIVLEHRGEIWRSGALELDQLLAGLKAEEMPCVLAIGPGKASRFGTSDSSRGRRKPARQRPFPLAAGRMPSIEWLPLEELNVDPSYQRSIDNRASQRLIASIATHFDWRLCAPLIVSRRADGAKVIIDGQHRWEAAKRRGDPPHLPCCLYVYENPADEAKVFIAANRSRKPISRLDDFHAALAAGDDDACEVRRLVEEAGLSIARTSDASQAAEGEIAFTSSILAASRGHGDGVASAALTCLGEAYAGRPICQGAAIFGGLVMIFAAPPNGFDPDEMVPALRGLSTERVCEVLRDVRGPRARAAAVSREIIAKLGSYVERSALN